MACPFCALGLHHFAPSAKVAQQFRQRARFVHPDKQTTGDADAEFKLLGATRDLALLYTETGAMPFHCLGLPRTLLPDPVPIVCTSTTNVNQNVAATRWPAPKNPFTSTTNNPIKAATRWPAPKTSGCADQETNPDDSHMEWTQRTWRWMGKCQQRESSACSDWAKGAAPPRLVGWLVETAHPVPEVQQVVDFLGNACSEAT